MKKNIKAMFTSDSTDWYTPTYIYKFLVERFNQGKPFEFDPCGAKNSPTSQLILNVNDINNGGEDGLELDWSKYKSVFINPPFGRELPKWIEKAYRTNLEHRTHIVMLIPARTDVRAWHKYIFGEAEVHFIKGRIKFADITGKETLSAPFPSAIIVFGESNPICRPIEIEKERHINGL